MSKEKFTVAEVLGKILKKDPTILGRRDDLVQTLDENRSKIMGTQMKSLRSLQKVLRESNIGDIFAAVDSRTDKNKDEAMEVAKKLAEQKLRESSTQEQTIQNVIEIFITALEWDKREKIPVQEEAASVKQEDVLEEKVSSNNSSYIVNEETKDSENISSQNLTDKVPNSNFSRGQLQQQSSLETKLQSLQSRKKKQRNIFISIVAVLVIIIGFVIFNNTFSKDNLKSENQSVTQQVDNNNVTGVESKAKSDLSLGGIDLGSDKKDMEDLYGRPDELKRVDGYMHLYYHGKFEVTENEDFSIKALVSDGEDVKTKRGIHEGSTISDMEKAYGTNYIKSDNNDVILYEYIFPSMNGDSGILRFAVNKSDNTVKYISVRLDRDNTYSNQGASNKNGVAKLTKMRVGRFYDNMTRLVFESQGMVQEPNISIVNSRRLTIDVPNAQVVEEEQRDVSTSFIKDVSIEQLDKNTVRVTINTNVNAEYNNYKVFGLSNPDRLVIDVGQNVKSEIVQDATKW